MYLWRLSLHRGLREEGRLWHLHYVRTWMKELSSVYFDVLKDIIVFSSVCRENLNTNTNFPEKKQETYFSLVSL